MEPALECAAALWSPSTGIVDSHGYMTALLGDAERAGAVLALLTPLVEARRAGRGWRVVTGGADALALETRWLVNAAGLQAQPIAARMHGFPPRRRAAAASRQGQLLRAARPVAVLAPDLSDARATAASACT